MITVSEAELVAVAKNLAEPETERRVLAAALHDPVIQHRLERLQQPSSPSDIVELLQRVTQSVVREQAQAKLLWWQPFREQLRRKWEFTAQPLRLPLLAPALAAPAETLLLQREVFEQEGVRVELHQLPGTSPRLRAIVNVSPMPEAAFNSVALAFQEAGREPFVAVVHLNREKRGLREWEVGGTGELGFPAPLSTLSLIGLAVLELS